MLVTPRRARMRRKRWTKAKEKEEEVQTKAEEEAYFKEVSLWNTSLASSFVVTHK